MKLHTVMLPWAAGLMALLAASSCWAVGDAVAGREKSQVCAACHGPRGNGDNPAYPKLAGQYPSYLVKALQDYRSGQRQNAIMKGFAAGLSDEDIEDLSAFFAAQSGDLYVPEPD